MFHHKPQYVKKIHLNIALFKNMDFLNIITTVTYFQKIKRCQIYCVPYFLYFLYPYPFTYLGVRYISDTSSLSVCYILLYFLYINYYSVIFYNRDLNFQALMQLYIAMVSSLIFIFNFIIIISLLNIIIKIIIVYITRWG